MPARTYSRSALALALATAFALLTSAGCELIVDFDRSKIPMAGNEAPSRPDGSVEPEDDAGTDEDAGN